MTHLPAFLLGLLAPPAGACLTVAGLRIILRRARVPFLSARHFLSTWCGASGGCLGSALTGQEWLTATGAAISLVLALLIIGWRRRRRRRAPRLAGSKTRAILAAMTRALRELAQPRPVPQGAR